MEPDFSPTVDDRGRLRRYRRSSRLGFQHLWSRVELFEATPHILPAEDDDVAAAFQHAKHTKSMTAVSYYRAATRGIIDGQSCGFCKLIVDQSTAEILGCHVVGEQATNVVQVAAMAPAAGMRRVDDLARAPVSFPTYAEILIFTAVRAAKKLNLEIGWRTLHTA